MKCPECKYDPVEAARANPLQNSALVTAEGELQPDAEVYILDAFEILGADDGNVFCPRCGCEFPVDDDDLPDDKKEGQQLLF